MGVESGRGVNIVNITKDHKYKLDKYALQEILLKEEVKECPVVVVSIVGICRGGKSFLLDFFLRYLYFKYFDEQTNSMTPQPDSTWLGDENQELKGFSWRGGMKPDTAGILLWSEPIFAALPSGEKVVILLMDTQGTFDNSSTLRDCSTIFALSTLLSSMLIYNISQNMTEDHLQHLQLFAEYGRWASNIAQKPFQYMKFLIRDWRFDEYAFGTNGGQQLLREKLQVNDSQAPETQELRQQIISCFEDISCFLMPYPGETVAANSRFKGKLSDINPTFKNSLKELVPSIFETQNLIVKRINGRMVKAKDLYHYVETYLTEFNGNKLPEPTTVTKAIQNVGISSAKEQARADYTIAMDNVCGATRPSLSPDMLRHTHSTTLEHVLDTLSASLNMIMGIQNYNRSHLNEIEQELEKKLEQYEMINTAKVTSAISGSVAAYEASMRSVAHLEQKCLHPRDLEESHNAALETAMRIFDSNRIPPEGIEDVGRKDMLRDFAQRYENLKSLNDTMNNGAVLEARSDYFTYMESLCGAQPCMTTEQIELKHEEAVTRAIELFNSMRSRDHGFREDAFLSRLKKDIEERFTNLQSSNARNNRAGIRAAVSCYTNRMAIVCHTQQCLHPDDFLQEHEDARDAALNEFYSRRLSGQNEDDEDEYKQAVIQELSTHYEELYNTNERKNESTVQAAVDAYETGMVGICGPGQPRRPADQMAAAHNFAVNGALRTFNEKRRDGPQHTGDRYRDNLMQVVDERYRYYQENNNNNPVIQQLQQVDEEEFSALNTLLMGVAVTAGVIFAVGAVAATGGLAAVGAGAGTVISTVSTVEGAGVIASAAATGATLAVSTWRGLRRIFSRDNRQDD